MVGSTGKAMLSSLTEVALELLVHLVGTFCCLDHHEADGTGINGTVALQFCPVYVALIVTDVNTMDVIALGIGHLTQPLTYPISTILIE